MRSMVAVAAFTSFVVCWGVADVGAQIRPEFYVTGLDLPVAMVQDPSRPLVQYVVEKTGRVRVISGGVLLAQSFLDVSTAITMGGEQGLLGLAISPITDRVFINYTDLAGNTVIARFSRSTGDPLRADPASQFNLRWASLSGLAYIPQPFANHNGGNLVVGPDGYLYIALGDGGSGDDPENNAQRTDTLLGKMLRVDVNVADTHPNGYVIPADNPFLDGDPVAALPEIWAFGLRNPWRYSFDDGPGGTGALILGDVGQVTSEEIDYEPANTGGRNYGWRVREGSTAHIPSPPPAYTPLTDPVYDYPRTLGQAVTGGYVYRGSGLASFFRGRYFFADFVTGRIWSLRLTPTPSGAVADDLREHTAELGGNAVMGAISSFGRDAAGELYVVSYAGAIVRIADNSRGPDSVITDDFNGDNLDDVFLYDRNATGAFSIGFSTGVGTFTAGPAGGWATGWNVTRADFDGNGLADLFLHNPLTGTWVKVINDGGGVFSYFAGGWLTEFTPYVTDLNGDGKSDVFLYGPATGRWLKCLSVGDGRVGFDYLSGGWRAGWNLQLADWNGDGLADFFLIDSTGLWFKATNDGAAGFSYFSGGWLTGYTPHIVDLNGDGWSDVFLYNEITGHWFKCLSVAPGTFGFSYESGGWAPHWTLVPANFDLGTATDFLLYSSTTGTFVKVVNDGARFNYSSGGWATWQLEPGDFNGDSRTDLLLFSSMNGQWFEALSTTPMQFAYTTGIW